MIGSYMKDHAERNNIWDRSQLGTCSDKATRDKVRNQQRNLAVAFYAYQKAYDMVRHDWMIRVYQLMGVPEKVVNVITKLMEGWNEKISTSRTIKRRERVFAKRVIFQ